MAHAHDVIGTIYYDAIAEAYKGKHAKRTGLPYIKHINDGLKILERIGATQEAMYAYCLHPITQADEDFAAFMQRYGTTGDAYQAFDPYVIALAVEYRNCANRYLSMHQGKETRTARLSPVPEVNDMLIADKVQNYHDFAIHHAKTHPNAATLETYFRDWFAALDVDPAEFEDLFNDAGYPEYSHPSR